MDNNTKKFEYPTNKDDNFKNNNSSKTNDGIVENTIKKTEGVKNTVKETIDIEDKNAPYTDRRSVTIALVENYSLYRRVNSKVLNSRKEWIGSCITSSRILSSNKKEVETYFPNIIGLAPNNPDFITRVKQYLNNIKIGVDKLGKTLDISFYYYNKEDYIKCKIKEEKIDTDYAKVPRNDLRKLKEAMKLKISQLNDLESSKCTMGYPINIDDYIAYRHCLLYNDVAKDLAFINSDNSIRFYFKDDKKEEEKRRKYREAVNKAKANFVKLLADDKLFEAVYIQYLIINGLPILASLRENLLDKELKLDKFSNENPIKFNELVNNKHINVMANIEKLIAHGELIRPQFSQNITLQDGTFIGANMNEAIQWFNNPENSNQVNILLNKLIYIE